MIKKIILPDLGEGIDSAEISELSVSVGDSIAKNDTVLVLESDKASMEIPSDFSGTIKEFFVSVGDKIKTGQPLLTIDVKEKIKASNKKTKEINIEKEKPSTGQSESSDKQKKPVKLVSEGERKSFASPGVRRLARELEINLSLLRGSGPKGRVTKNDLHSYIKLQMTMSSGVLSPIKRDIDFSKWGNIETRKLTKVNKITGERLGQAWKEIPHVTQFNKVDITSVNQLRKKMKEEGLKKDIKVTFLPFFMKAAVIVLKEMPVFNSSLDKDGENLILKNYFNIGVAIDTPDGLVVPSIKEVDKKSIFNLSKELTDISDRARNKKLIPNELSGGTFTISSLGGIGGTYFSPIVNPPEVAILGISKSEWGQVYDSSKQEFSPRFMLPVSLSYDHRVIDGAAGARFVERLGKVLNNIKNFIEQ